MEKQFKDSFLTEEQVKTFVNDYYIERGYQTAVAWGYSHGVDIIAQKGNERLVIEVKGCGSRNPMRVNYFLAIIGEILQRMNNEESKYYIALPKIQQYKNLWDRLPILAKQRTAIKLILVDENGRLEFYE